MNSFRTLLRITVFVLGGVVIGLLGWRVGRSQKKPDPVAVNSPLYGTVAAFSFINQLGMPFGTADLKNRWWVADFIFTQCMGPCPLLTTRMAELQKEFSNKASVSFVSFSVDPDHDTPAALSKYAASYGANTANWNFLTGPKEKIYTLIRESFHLAVEKSPPEKPSVNDILHSLYFVLVDPQGNVRGYFNINEPDSMKKLRDALTNT